MSNPWIQAALTTAALTLLQMFLSFLVPPSAGGGAGGLGFVLLSNALTASLLVWIARRLRVRGLARAVVLWAIWGGIQAISLIELLVFDIGVPRGDLPWLALHSLAVSACLALFLGLAFPAEARAGGAPPAAAPPSVWWRLAASGLAYVVLYFAAGMLAYPYVREFYEARPMPAMGTLLVVQPVRGLAFGAIVLLVVRQIRASRFGAAVAAGSTMSILGAAHTEPVPARRGSLRTPPRGRGVQFPVRAPRGLAARGAAASDRGRRSRGHGVRVTGPTRSADVEWRNACLSPEQLDGREVTVRSDIMLTTCADARSPRGGAPPALGARA